MIYIFFLFYFIFLCYMKSRIYFVLLVFSTRVCVFVKCYRNIQVDFVVPLSTLAIDR